MLKSIPAAFTPDLLWALAAMGHGDRLAIVDRNYPAHSLHSRVLPLAGHDTVQAATLITSLMPIDDYIEPAAFWMIPDGGSEGEYEAHTAFRAVVEASEGRPVPFESIERTRFYAEARSAFAVITTTDTRPFSCFLLTKGVINVPDI